MLYTDPERKGFNTKGRHARTIQNEDTHALTLMHTHIHTYIHAVVCMLGLDPDSKCRQYNRKTAGSSDQNVPAITNIERENALFESMSAEFIPVPCTIDVKTPVSSIDQLYAQVWMRVCMYINIYIYIYIYIYISYVYICVCVCVCIYIYIYIY